MPTTSSSIIALMILLLASATTTTHVAAPTRSRLIAPAPAPAPIPFPYLPAPIENSEEGEGEGEGEGWEELWDEVFLPDLPFEYHHPTDAAYPEGFFPWRGLFKTPPSFLELWWEEQAEEGEGEGEGYHVATLAPGLRAPVITSLARA